MRAAPKTPATAVTVAAPVTAEVPDAEGAFAATAVGLDVLPGHEELVGLRLQAHALTGDRVALRREYACYEQAVLADPWDGEPSPELAALRHELLGAVPVAGD